MSFTVPATYSPGEIVLVRQILEGADCLVLGTVRSIEAICTCPKEREVSYSYTIVLSPEKVVSVPEGEIFYRLNGYDSLYRHDLINFLRHGQSTAARELDRREKEYEEKHKDPNRFQGGVGSE